ncbi:PTS sugar transporter subunit IIB [Ligilactobacillus sp. LYQ60]|uniref:PTS sugar transporter subunit IIB n=1 Tax=unclassified Ligilactobacillus TaxID=2767920 RepID=UPI0038555543
MIKVLAACGSGMGSSMMIRLKIQKILKDMGIDAQVESTSVSEAKSIGKQYDIVVVSEQLTNQFSEMPNTHLVGLKNLMDDAEIKDKITPLITK